MQSQTANKSVNRTPKSYAFGFPPLRSGAGYVQRQGIHTRYEPKLFPHPSFER